MSWKINALAHNKKRDHWNETGSLETHPRTSGKVDIIKATFQISEESV